MMAAMVTRFVVPLQSLFYVDVCRGLMLKNHLQFQSNMACEVHWLWSASPNLKTHLVKSQNVKPSEILMSVLTLASLLYND